MPTVEHLVKKQIAELVSKPSVSSTDPSWDSSNMGVIDCLAEFAESQGFSITTQKLGGDKAKANLVARLGPDFSVIDSNEVTSQAGGGLVLSGHTDTVPFDAGRWQSDPFVLSERDGKLFGLGSTDMKGFFAIALAAVRELDYRQFKTPLYLLATADEESSMFGARELKRHSLAGASAAIIGEPTSLRPIRLHKGIMMQGIRLIGKSGHSSDPSLGNNVIDAVPELLKLLDEYRTSLASQFRCELLAVPGPTINFGCLHGGDSPNRICGELDFHFDVRMLPGLKFEDIESELGQFIQKLAKQRGINIEMRRLLEPVPAFEQSVDSEIIAVSEVASGQAAGGVNYSTEAPFLQKLGLETVVLGPGSIDCAHQPNEYLELSQIKPAIKILRDVIAHYCL